MARHKNKWLTGLHCTFRIVVLVALANRPRGFSLPVSFPTGQTFVNVSQASSNVQFMISNLKARMTPSEGCSKIVQVIQDAALAIMEVWQGPEARGCQGHCIRRCCQGTSH